MEFLYFIKSYFVGLAISSPIGPIGMLCIRKNFELGFKAGVSVGLGAAFADSVFALIAGAGFSAVSNFLLHNLMYIKIFGGAFLISLGIRDLQTLKDHVHEVHTYKKHSLTLAFQTFLLTGTNPLTILSFLGIFTTIAGTDASLIHIITMVVGIFLGSISWWIFLSSLVLKMRKRLSVQLVETIRTFSSWGLIGFGVFTILSMFWK